MITNFEQFKRNIRALGGAWESDGVYFSQMKDGYYADFRPKYPKRSLDDMTIYSGNVTEYTLLCHLGEEWFSRRFECFADMYRAFKKAREAGAKV